MSSYRGTSGGPWDGGPPGAEADYAPPRPSQAPAPYAAMPSTDPWTGVSYSQYAPPLNYDYSAYTASSVPGAQAYAYHYDSNYYQRPDGNYYGKYPETYPPQQSNYDYSAKSRVSRSRSRSPNSRNYRRRSFRSQSRSVSPYDRRERAYSRKRDSSYEADRGRYRSRSRSVKSKHSRYSSSDRSSHSDRRSKLRKSKVRRSRSPASSASQKSYVSKKTSRPRSFERSLTPPPRKNASKTKKAILHTSNKRSYTRSPSPIDTKGLVKGKSSKEIIKDKKHRSVTTPPPKKRKEISDKSTVTPPKNYKKLERSSTPLKTNRYKGHKSETVTKKSRESSLTPPKSYARSRTSSSSRSRSRSSSIGHSKRRSFTPKSKSGKSRSRSSSSRSSCSRRSRSKTRRSRRRSKSKTMSKSRSPSLSKSKATKLKAKSRSCSQSNESRSGSPSEDERRGQFTVADRKRFWKLHRTRQEERAKGKSDRTPPKEVKPPPGAVESTTVDDVYYGDPPEVEGPNFAELLPALPPDLAQASSSKSKPMTLPIKNDGSFLEMFKKMQEQTKQTEVQKPAEIKKPVLPFIGKRRGGRVLKTGLVKKAKAIDEQPAEAPKDAWSLYMQEVKKYRETSCEEERKTRPLVKYIMPEMIKSPADLKTAPFDPRFPNQNQTRHCYQSYLDFYRCQKVRGEKYEPCNYFKRVFTSLCPMDWVEKWDSQRADGIFPGKI